MTTLRVIRRLLGGGGGNNAWSQKWQLSLKFLCRQQLCQLSLTISCQHFQSRWSGGIGCWDCLLKLSAETNCWDQFRSVVEFIWFYHPLRLSMEVSYWDYLWNQQSRLPVKVSPWVYLLRSMFEIHIICWNQQLRLYVEFSCSGSQAKPFLEIRNWDYQSRSNHEVICWNWPLKLFVEINL